jgi:RNA polymerase sigma factor (TIGR02999 family)
MAAPGIACSFTETVYPALRISARRLFARERRGHTLQADALVHEAWLRMAAAEQSLWRDPAHFCAAAKRHMRRILIDQGRQFRSYKHEGNGRVSLDEARYACADDAFMRVELRDLLDRLNRVCSPSGRVVRLKFFFGMTDREIAIVMGCSTRSVRRYWRIARTWLRMNWV